MAKEMTKETTSNQANNMSIQNSLVVASGGFKILSGIAGLGASKKIRKEQEKIAKLQFDFNKKEVNRAFGTNFKNLTREYAKESSSLYQQAKDSMSQININLGKKNVESESIESDIQNEFKNGFEEMMGAFLQNKSFAFEELVNQKLAQIYNIGADYNSALNSITQNYLAQRSQAINQIIEGSADIGKAVASGGGA